MQILWRNYRKKNNKFERISRGKSKEYGKSNKAKREGLATVPGLVSGELRRARLRVSMALSSMARPMSRTNCLTRIPGTKTPKNYFR